MMQEEALTLYALHDLCHTRSLTDTNLRQKLGHPIEYVIPSGNVTVLV